MTDEEFIRSRAAMNWSKRMVSAALGISDWKFREMCAAMPDLKWGPPNSSPDRIRWSESRKGVSTPGKREAQKKAVAACKRKRSVWLGSEFKTVPEHMADYAEFIDVSLAQVNRRLANGMSLYDALFLGPQPCAAVYKHGNWSNKNGDNQQRN